MGIKIIQTADVVDLAEAVRVLAADGLPRVLCEGGPRLHRDLLAADLVDELSLTLSPTVVGGDGQRSTSGWPSPINSASLAARPVGRRRDPVPQLPSRATAAPR